MIKIPIRKPLSCQLSIIRLDVWKSSSLHRTRIINALSGFWFFSLELVGLVMFLSQPASRNLTSGTVQLKQGPLWNETCPNSANKKQLHLLAACWWASMVFSALKGNAETQQGRWERWGLRIYFHSRPSVCFMWNAVCSISDPSSQRAQNVYDTT